MKLQRTTKFHVSMAFIATLLFLLTHWLYGRLCWHLTTASESFWTEAAIYCLHAIIDRMISVECCHTNFNLYIQI